MTLIDKEKDGFLKVISIFKSVADECKDDILNILENDIELKIEAEEEVEKILKIREGLNSISDYKITLNEIEGGV